MRGAVRPRSSSAAKSICRDGRPDAAARVRDGERRPAGRRLAPDPSAEGEEARRLAPVEAGGPEIAAVDRRRPPRAGRRASSTVSVPDGFVHRPGEDEAARAGSSKRTWMVQRSVPGFSEKSPRRRAMCLDARRDHLLDTCGDGLRRTCARENEIQEKDETGRSADARRACLSRARMGVYPLK